MEAILGIQRRTIVRCFIITRHSRPEDYSNELRREYVLDQAVQQRLADGARLQDVVDDPEAISSPAP